MNKKSHSTLARSQWRTYSPSPPSKQVTPAPLATPKMQRAARHAPGAAVSSWSLDQCSGQRKLRVLGTRGTLDTERISNRSKSPESSRNLTCSSEFRLIPPFRYHTALVRVLPPQTPAAPANSSGDWAFSSFSLWAFMHGVMHTMGACVEVREDVWELVLSPHHASRRDRTQDIKPWQQAPSPAAPSLQTDTHSLLSFLTSGLVYLPERSKPMP